MKQRKPNWLGDLERHRLTKDTDNFETRGLEPVLRDWLEGIELPFDATGVGIDTIEFRPRSGFIPHSHNHGGMDLFADTTVSYLIGSGEHFGLGIESWVQDVWTRAYKELGSEHPELGEDSDELFDKVYEDCGDDYSGIAWRIRAMYEGDGVLTVYAGYDFDAPYYRWDNGADFEATIEFKDLDDLADKLQKLSKRVVASQRRKPKSRRRVK